MLIEASNHFLFAEENAVKIKKYKPVVHCTDCINADCNKIGLNGRIFCTKYNMWTYQQQTCKAGKKEI